MSKKYSMFLTALFCGFLGLTVAANALTPDKDFSELENRALAQRPRLSWRAVRTGEFMTAYEKYITDQFVLRDGWTAAKALSEKLVGKRENNGVYLCDDSTLITRFDPPDPRRVENNAGYVAQFAEKAGVPVTFGLIPTQAFLWADRLPEGAPNYDQRKVYTDATAFLAGKADLSDSLWSILPDHKNEGIFYRTDHHWTSLGAYYGYRAILGDMYPGGEESAVPLESYPKTTVSTDFYGTVFSSSGVRWVKPDEIDIYVPGEGISVTSHTYDSKGRPVEEPRSLYDMTYLSKKDKYSMFLGGQQSLGVVKTGRPDKPRLLLIRDSYSDSLVPFLTPHFSEIHLMDFRYCKLSPSQYIKEHSIDRALVLYSVPNFANDANLLWIAR